MHGPCMHAYSMRKAASYTTFSCTDSQASVRLLLRLSMRRPVYSNSDGVESLQELGVNAQGAIRCCWQMSTERQPQTWSSCCAGKAVLHAHADALAMTSSDYKQPENDAISPNPSPHRYKLRAKVDVADISDEASVWVSFGPPAARHGVRCIFSGALDVMMSCSYTQTR
jgi:hypothetical protein